MAHFIRLVLFLGMTLSLTGCFELIEDTTIHKDGSGEYKLTLNMSASQTRLNSIMALDSIKGKKVPSEAELNKEITGFIQKLNGSSGISNANYSLNTDTWILKFSCSFDSLPCLKQAINHASKKWLKKEEDLEKFEHISISYNGREYVRSFSAEIKENTRQELKKDEEFGQLAEGKCVFIQRFDQTVESVSHSQVKVAKNSKATMLMTSPTAVLNDPSLLDYKVILR